MASVISTRGETKALSSVPQPPPKIARLSALTSLRFFAAAMIVIVHSRGAFGISPTWGGNFDFVQAVSFFFVLSGFILTYVHPDLSGSSVRSFLRARFARLWPAHVATLLIFLALFPEALPERPSGTSFAIYAANLGLIHAWIPLSHSYFSGNDVSWSISTECFFALIFPLLLARSWRGWVRTLLISGGLAVFAIVLADYLHTHIAIADDFGPSGGVTTLGLVYINPIARLFEFAVGMATAALWRVISPRIQVGRIVGTFIEVSVIGVAIYALMSIQATAAHIFGVGGQSVAWYQWMYFSGGNVLVFALLVAVFALERGWIARLLTYRLPVLLGEISFAVYLVHHIVLRYISAHPRTFGWMSGWLAYLVFWLVTLVAAHLLWAFVERPARRWLLGYRTSVARDNSRDWLTVAVRQWRWQVVEMSVFIIAIVFIVRWQPVVHIAGADSMGAEAIAVTTPQNLRDVVFSDRFRLVGATVNQSASGITLQLAWQSVGVQKLVYAVIVQPLDAAGDPLTVYSQPQDQLERTADDGTIILQTFAIPPEVAANANTIGVVLYRNPPEYLVADRGPRDNEGRRLLITVPNR